MECLSLHSLEMRELPGDVMEVLKNMKEFNKDDIYKVSTVPQEIRTHRKGYTIGQFSLREEKIENLFASRKLDGTNLAAMLTVQIRLKVSRGRRLQVVNNVFRDDFM